MAIVHSQSGQQEQRPVRRLVIPHAFQPRLGTIQQPVYLFVPFDLGRQYLSHHLGLTQDSEESLIFPGECLLQGQQILITISLCIQTENVNRDLLLCYLLESYHVLVILFVEGKSHHQLLQLIVAQLGLTIWQQPHQEHMQLSV